MTGATKGLDVSSVQVGQGTPKDKIYYHRTPGAKFYMPDGKEVSFAGGELRLSSIPSQFRGEVQRELDRIADVPTSHIYTKQEVIDPGEVAARDEIMQTAEHQFDKDNKIEGNPKTVPLPQAAPGKPQLPSSLKAAQAAVASAGQVAQ